MSPFLPRDKRKRLFGSVKWLSRTTLDYSLNGTMSNGILSKRKKAGRKAQENPRREPKGETAKQEKIPLAKP